MTDQSQTTVIPHRLGVLNTLELPNPGTYRHFKGGYYHLAWVARLEATGEWMCCYAEIGKLGKWVRPAAEWLHEVSPGVQRFTQV